MKDACLNLISSEQRARERKMKERLSRNVSSKLENFLNIATSVKKNKKTAVWERRGGEWKTESLRSTSQRLYDVQIF